MLRSIGLLLLFAPIVSAADLPKPTVVATGVAKPNCVVVTGDRRTLVSSEDGIFEIKNGKGELFTDAVKSPRGMAIFNQSLFVVGEAGISRIELGDKKMMTWAALADFPKAPKNLQRLAVDERGTVYVTEATGDAAGIYQVSAGFRGRNQPPERKITIVADAASVPGLRSATGITLDSMNHLLIANGADDKLLRVRLPDHNTEVVVEGMKSISEPLFDTYGRLYFLSNLGKELWCIPRPGVKPVQMTEFDSAVTSLAYSSASNSLLMTLPNPGRVLSLPAQPPGFEIDDTPLPLKTEVVFNKLTFTGYDNGLDAGKEIPLRPIVLTHMGDGSNRIVIATQHGVIHSFKNGDEKTNVMLDIQSKCFYKDTENEQGLLGLTFHPKFKTNGELFVFYTDKSKRFENVLVRFRMKKDNPDQVDPASEEELLRIKHKYWNHDGGTVAFGPDGYLYVVLGDGGAGGDPDGHGQMKNTLLGKILRLDVDHKDAGLPYAIPKDNPFVGKSEYRPEIFALGVRNPWRLSFDRKTGQGWFAEVGQNLWEEINLLEKGGNYGWSVRESLHPFGEKGTGHRPEFIEPIWEYYHTLGKSITGGFVSRGSRLPEIEGHYIYADYVFAKIWALKYDETKKRVVANRPIADNGAAVMSFGEDESGELYILTYSATGKGISRIVRK